MIKRQHVIAENTVVLESEVMGYSVNYAWYQGDPGKSIPSFKDS